MLKHIEAIKKKGTTTIDCQDKKGCYMRTR